MIYIVRSKVYIMSCEDAAGAGSEEDANSDMLRGHGIVALIVDLIEIHRFILELDSMLLLWRIDKILILIP